MKKIFTILSVIAFSHAIGQSVMLRDFEGTAGVYFKDITGTLDTLFANPDMTGANTSSVCARYIRKNVEYDNIKAYATNVFVDISNWAQANTAHKLSMKVWSKMPVGTKIQIQLGSRMDQSYPGGVHSVYSATTAMTGQWETVTLNLEEVPPLGFKMPASVDKMVILFRPSSFTQDTVYFDDLMGPTNTPVALNEQNSGQPSISASRPNPVKDRATVSIDLVTGAHVSLVVYDLLGKPVATPLNEVLTAGSHDVVINTENFPNGVYFYTLKKGDYTKTAKMVVSR